jgi:transposase-like protein
MSEFKWRHFSGEIILQCVRWYCKYGISYRDLEEMMADLEWDEKKGGLTTAHMAARDH